MRLGKLVLFCLRCPRFVVICRRKQMQKKQKDFLRLSASGDDDEHILIMSKSVDGFLKACNGFYTLGVYFDARE